MITCFTVGQWPRFTRIILFIYHWEIWRLFYFQCATLCACYIQQWWCSVPVWSRCHQKTLLRSYFLAIIMMQPSTWSLGCNGKMEQWNKTNCQWKSKKAKLTVLFTCWMQHLFRQLKSQTIICWLIDRKIISSMHWEWQPLQVELCNISGPDDISALSFKPLQQRGSNTDQVSVFFLFLKSHDWEWFTPTCSSSFW